MHRNLLFTLLFLSFVGNEKTVQSVEPVAAGAELTTWLTRYETDWQSAIDVTKDAKARNFINVQLHIPTKDEQTLLRELGSWGVDDRLKLIKQVLAESKTRQDLPIEYVCHAATQGDDAVRTRIWTDLFQPQLAREDLSATEKEVLFRGIITLELGPRAPGLTTKLVDFLLANQPPPLSKSNLNPNDPAAIAGMPALAVFSQMLASTVCQTPAEEQDPVSLRFHDVAFSAVPRVRVLIDGLFVEPPHNSFPKVMLRSIESRLYPVEGLRPPRRTPEEQLAMLRDEQTAPAMLVQLLHDPGFKAEQLTDAEQRKVVMRLTNAPGGEPETERSFTLSAIAQFGLACDLADRRKLILETRPPAQQFGIRSGTIEKMDTGRKLLGQTPPEEFVELFMEISQDYPDLIRPIKEEAFSKLDSAKAKELIKRLSSKVLARDNSVLQAYALLSNRLERGERQKVHKFLLQQMTLISKEPQPAAPKEPRHPLDRPRSPLGEYVRVIGLSNDLSPETINDILALTYGFEGKLVAALQFFGSEGLPLLLAQMSPEQRAPLLKRGIDELQMDMHRRFAGQLLLEVISKVSSQLTPAESQQFAPHIAACAAYEFSTDQWGLRPSVGEYIAGRPKSERVELLKLLAKNVFQARFKTNSTPVDTSTGFVLINRVLRDIPEAEIAPLALFCLDLRMKGTNYDGATVHFLRKLFPQVPEKDRPQIGEWIMRQLPGELSTYQVMQLAEAHKHLPGALDLAGQQRLFDLIIERTATVVNAEGVKDQLKLDESHYIHVVQNGGEYLPSLLKTLPEAQTRPAIEALIDPLTKFARAKFAERKYGGDNENFANFIPALASTPYPLPPDKMQRVTAAYFTYVHDAHPVAVEKSQANAMKIRGTLPAGETKAWCDQIVQWPERKYSWHLDPGRYLKFLAGHVPPAEMSDFIAAVDVVLPLSPAPDPMRPGDKKNNPFAHLDIYRRLTPEMTPADAEQRIAELAKQTDAAQYKHLIVQLLEPVARENAVRFFELADAHELDKSPGTPYHFLSQNKDQAQVSKLLLARLTGADLKDADGRKGAGAVARFAPAEVRLQALDELAQPGADPALFTMIFMGGRTAAEEPAVIARLLRQPENVGLRRNVVIPARRSGWSEFVSSWRLMQE